MALKEKILKVLDVREIPQELLANSPFLQESEVKEYYLQVHLPDEVGDELDNWIIENYPELAQEDSFLLYVN